MEETPQPPLTGKEKEEGTRSFVHLLATLDDGMAAHEFDKVLNTLNRAMLTHNKGTGIKTKGTMGVTLNFELDGDVVKVMYDIKVKEPRLRRGSSTLFMTRQGNLSREMPKQLKLGLHAVDDAPPAAAPVPGAAQPAAPV